MAKDDTSELPISGTIRFARELPNPVRTLCIATPTSAGMAGDSGTQAQLDLICCQPAKMFDIERGGYVCDECGGALTKSGRDWQKIARQNPFDECDTVRTRERALYALAWIEVEMHSYYFREFPDASTKDFKAALPVMWEELGASLTYQVRLSTARVLGGSNN